MGKTVLRTLFIVSLLSVYACTPQEEETLTPSQPTAELQNKLKQLEELAKEGEHQTTYLTQDDLENMTKLGRQLENPYSLENMTKALQNLKANGEIPADVIIEASHLYLKFKPKNEAEFNILQRDTSLELYTYPLDYEIAEAGTFYHDPTLPVNQPTYQYCAVPINKVLPDDVEYEVLAELFIPEELEGGNNKRFTAFPYTRALVDEALLITGNQEKKKAQGSRRSRWQPKGNIMIWDDVAERNVPVHDVEVRATRWFTTHKGKTNAAGWFICDGTFENPAKYSIKWEKFHFSVRAGSFGQATCNGPDIKGDWHQVFAKEERPRVTDWQQYFALIFQAARDYYYTDRFGLSSPPKNQFLGEQVKISAMEQNESSHAAIYIHGGAFPSIYIRTWDSDADIVYAVTTHELAHYAHWAMDKEAFTKLTIDGFIGGKESDKAVIESWAEGVEWQFAQRRYTNLNVPNYQYFNNYQWRPIEENRVYTSIVVDMIDNENQRLTRGRGSTRLPVDNVSGYTIQQIEQSLKGAESWQKWRNNMFRHPNPTSIFLEELFDNWH